MIENCTHLKTYHVDCSVDPFFVKEHLCNCCVSLGILIRFNHHIVRCSFCNKYVLIVFFNKFGHINGYIDLTQGISCDLSVFHPF